MSGSLLSNNKSLNEALTKAAEAAVPTFYFPQPIHHVDTPVWDKTDAGKALLREVRESNHLQLFDDTLQRFGNSAWPTERDQLAHWMVERAQIVGAKQTIEEVERYIACDSFKAYQVMLLSRLCVDSEFDLGGDIRLVPAHEVPNERLKVALCNNMWNVPPHTEITSALIRPFHHQKNHELETNLTIDKREPLENFVSELESAHLCLALGRRRGIGVQAIASTTVAKDDVPILNRGFCWQIHSYRTPTIEPSLIHIEAQTTKSLHESFLKLHSDDQDHLRIAMQKLNECAVSQDLVQGAIDLRTALEALFLDDNVRGEQRYRLGLRAAIFSGGDIEFRKETQNRMMKAYDLCSAAVHNGRLSYKETNNDLLMWTKKLVRDTLCRMINEGNAKPDWKVMELTG